VLALVCAGVSWGAGTYDPATDMNSMYNTTKYTGAQAWWNAGYTGAGVDVAVIDTGVSPVPGLDGPGKIINGPDLSLESQNPAFRYRDTSGHGTFMAGLIAGKDLTITAPTASAYRGMAPDARIVNMKVGVADGGVDVSQVIAAINWVIQHRYDNGMNIRVISLSYGTNSLQSSSVDPLSFAVEQAWKKGIVVVAAAGNSGFQQGHGAVGLSNPAYNPYVIAVGGSDSMGTATLADDTVGPYSATSANALATRYPDLVAPGSHLQGLRVPGSYIDLNHPEGQLGDRYFRGTGTSQSAAITSGAVALVLQKYPAYTPDKVKALITSTGVPLMDPLNPSTPIAKRVQGSGEIALTPMLTAQLPKKTTQSFTTSTGTGSLEAARGADHMSDDGVVLQGEIDIFGRTYNAAAMATAMAAGNSWSGGTWNGNSWSGNSWSGNSWSGNTWSGNSWSGNSWSGNSWSGNSWSGSGWSGNSWSGNSWSGNSWSGNSWSGGTYYTNPSGGESLNGGASFEGEFSGGILQGSDWS
jgi:serine protease AprX